MQYIINKVLCRRSFLSYLLLPFSLFYITVSILNRKVYELSIIKPYKSHIKLISVGNIVSGGTGKTPFTIFLTNFLTDMGFSVVVSHRGYKGKFENKNIFISNHKKIYSFAKFSGDEPYLLAQNLPGIPIVVGKRRTQSIKMIEKEYPKTDFIILDDSFQHYKIKQDIKFLLFNESGKIGNGFVLPAGILREPVSAVKRADWIVYNGVSEPFFLKKTTQLIRGDYIVSDIFDRDDNSIDLSILIKKRICLLSGIGLPKSFEKTVKEIGINFFKHYIYTDHYHYTEKDVKNLEDLVLANNTDFLLTTEKDYSKLRNLNITNIPLLIVKIKFSISKENQENLQKFFAGFSQLNV